MSELEFDESHYRTATERGERERAQSPVPLSVRFDQDTGRLLVEFTNGAGLLVPARSLQGLEDATDALSWPGKPDYTGKAAMWISPLPG